MREDPLILACLNMLPVEVDTPFAVRDFDVAHQREIEMVEDFRERHVHVGIEAGKRRVAFQGGAHT